MLISWLDDVIAALGHIARHKIYFIELLLKIKYRYFEFWRLSFDHKPLCKIFSQKLIKEFTTKNCKKD